MQANPLLEKPDWIFTSATWTLTYPDTKVLPLSRPISDHTPYVIQIISQISKSPILDLKIIG
jgi:endonuclease/exonuclease/phosphatase family metal-dependent hydrolase